MDDYSLNQFVTECREVISKNHHAATNVEKLAPLMHRLLAGDKSFLKPEHFKSHPDHYARNAIYIADDNLMNVDSKLHYFDADSFYEH